MGLVYEYKVELFLAFVIVLPLQYFVQTAIANELGVASDAKVTEGIHPIVLHGRWIDNQNICVLTVLFDKALGYHCSHDGLTRTHHVGKEETVVLFQHLIALNDGISLILQIHVALRQGHREVIFHLIAKGIDEHFDIEFVGSWHMVEMGLLSDTGNIIRRERNGLFPQLTKLLLAIADIGKVLHGYVQLIAWRLSDAKTGVRYVRTTHDDPSVGVFVVMFGQTQVELGVEVLRLVNTHFYHSIG